MLHAVASPLLDPAELAKLHSLQVVARMVVEGLQSGAHRSPHRGQSVDFADHRPYVAGDDLRHLDWKVLGRSDRLVLKRYEAETELACTALVDGSASMSYRGARAAWDKYRCAAVLAAALTYLILGQQDRAGLVVFDEKAAHEVRPQRSGQLERVCRVLEGHKPAGGTDAGHAIERLLLPETPRGLVLLISDLMAEPTAIEACLDRLGRRGHDVAVVWVLDPDERDLGVGVPSRFEGLEGEGVLAAEPRALRSAYIEVVAAHRLAVETACRRRKMAFVECGSDEPPHLPLNRLLLALDRR